MTIPNDNVSDYAVYEGVNLKRAVFVNLHVWLSNSTGTRPSVYIDFLFNGTGFVAKTVRAKRLLINHADDAQNLMFAGPSSRLLMHDLAGRL